MAIGRGALGLSGHGQQLKLSAKSSSCRLTAGLSEEEGQNRIGHSQGVAESEAHCINTDANHTSRKFSKKISARYFLTLMLTKEYVFVFTSFLLLHKFKNEDDLTSAWFLHIMHLVEPNQMLLDF